MESLKKLYKDLERYSHFGEGAEYPEKFLETADKIILLRNPDSISELLKYFDDESEYTWVFESLKISIDYFDSENVVFHLFKNLPNLLKKSPIWSSAILNRILNAEECEKFFIKNAHLAKKKDIFYFLETFVKEYPHHKEKIKELRDLLKNNLDSNS